MAGPSTLRSPAFCSLHPLSATQIMLCVLVYRRLSLRITTQWGDKQGITMSPSPRLPRQSTTLLLQPLHRFCTRITQTGPLRVHLQRDVVGERALPADSGKNLQGPTSLNISSFARAWSPTPLFYRISASHFICGVTSPSPEEEIW